MRQRSKIQSGSEQWFDSSYINTLKLVIMIIICKAVTEIEASWKAWTCISETYCYKLHDFPANMNIFPVTINIFKYLKYRVADYD